MIKISKIVSDFALLDVTTGRSVLAKRLGFNPNLDKRIPVTITGFIEYAAGKDDGVSQEFVVQVTEVVVS